jgi:hypothetical protein|tara:strand:- start:90 stop:386 length:297 start_codon:yes stop_codon:yes gene_type:complete
VRKNTRAVLDAWEGNKHSGKSGDSIWTDGKTIYSYGTWILTMEAIDRWPHNRVLFNSTKYSPTTSAHQNAIKGDLTPWVSNKDLVIVDDISIGTTISQ